MWVRYFLKAFLTTCLVLLTLVTGIANAALICCELSAPAETPAHEAMPAEVEDMPCHSESHDVASSIPSHDVSDDHASCDCPDCSQLTTLKFLPVSDQPYVAGLILLGAVQLPYSPVYRIYQPPRSFS